MIDGFTFTETSQHEKRRHEDALYAAYLGNAYRFSLDWASLQPAPHANFNRKYVESALAMIHELRERGVRLMLVLHHFASPNWFIKAGGFEDMSETNEYWDDYVHQCIEIFGSHIEFWNTFNEPNVMIAQGWLTGIFPPFLKGRKARANRILENCSLCHVRAAKAIHHKFPDAKVGISLNTVVFRAKSVLSRSLARTADHWFNTVVADAFAPECDFMGFSYYTRLTLAPGPITPVTSMRKMVASGLPHDDMNEYYPEGMYIHGKRLWERYHKPLLITESGTATTDCNFRIRVIKDYFMQMRRLMDDGIPLLGVFHWSMQDNAEWVLGFKMRFGLVYVDNNTEHRTFNRTLKRSGEFWHSVVERNGFSRDDTVPMQIRDPVQAQLAHEHRHKKTD
jgi:beta-glucosidase